MSSINSFVVPFFSHLGHRLSTSMGAWSVEPSVSWPFISLGLSQKHCGACPLVALARRLGALFSLVLQTCSLKLLADTP